MTTELKTILLVEPPIETEIQLTTNEIILREREEGINTLCNEVQQVSEIFQDLSILVQDQGNNIDNIETNITQTSNYTERGERQLIKASRYQKSSRKCMCIGLCVTSFGLLILIILLTK